MNEMPRIFDPVEYPATDEGITVFMADAFETGDAACIAHAVGVVAPAMNAHRPHDRPARPHLSLSCRHLPPNTRVHPSSALPATHFPVSA